jgi:hypothetical protein
MLTDGEAVPPGEMYLDDKCGSAVSVIKEKGFRRKVG